VAGCCNPIDYRRLFSRKYASRDAKRYRRRGLGGTSRALVELAGDVNGATVLDVGGGIGAIELELLAAGADRATNVELSGGYEEAAAALLSERGVSERVHRRVADFVTEGDAVEPHDLVVLHRVVCCYPDYERLLAAVADHARRLVVFSYPPSNVVSRALVGVGNVLFRLRGRDFRLFTHPPAAMLAVVEEQGFRRTFAHRALVWRAAGLERAT